mmetsp:Transcript_10466/g.12303  ORF Transcript_10466/g.12303 Transcript_10466/m.12303 type:complete len:386 (+) Transcript_10466:77-1234(+)
MKINYYNWSVVTLATVAIVCLIKSNEKVSSLDDKVEHLLEENKVLESATKSARSLEGDDLEKLKEDVMKISSKVKKNKKGVAANARNIDRIVHGKDLHMDLICPVNTVLLPHYGTESSSSYCGDEVDFSDGGMKCVAAFTIEDGTNIGCDEVVDKDRTDQVNVVDACCKAKPKCPDGTEEAWHYGSTSSISYCAVGTQTVPRGSKCKTAFSLPLGKEEKCENVIDEDSRSDLVLACCYEPEETPAPISSPTKTPTKPPAVSPTCPPGSNVSTLIGDGDMAPVDHCVSLAASTRCVEVHGGPVPVHGGPVPDCFEVIPPGEEVQVCCGGNSQLCFDVPTFILDGSKSAKDVCADGTCNYAFLLEDLSVKISCDETAGVHIQACCFM